ncbi:MAG: ATP-dependent DNA ligase, partial [Thermoproteota archaeon]
MRDLSFSVVAEYYEKIEATTGRIEMTMLLVDLFRKAPPDVIDKVAYLTLGQVAPEFAGVELGLGEKLVIRAIATATGIPQQRVAETMKKLGDVGKTAEWAVQNRSTLGFFQEELTVGRVYSSLLKIAEASGPSSQDLKIRLLSGLLSDAEPREARYIARIVTGRLRLGVRDMTLLDALAEAFLGGRERREEIERRYNVYPDIG